MLNALRKFLLSVRKLLIIVALTLLAVGCQSERVLSADARHPVFTVRPDGLLFGNTYIQLMEAPKILDDIDVPKDRTIHIRLDPRVRDMRFARTLMGVLGASGYTRPVLVTERHAEAFTVEPKKRK